MLVKNGVTCLNFKHFLHKLPPSPLGKESHHFVVNNLAGIFCLNLTHLSFHGRKSCNSVASICKIQIPFS